MASDSEGLRHNVTAILMISSSNCRKWLPIRKGYDLAILLRSISIPRVENGFRFGRVTTTGGAAPRSFELFGRKWLPIRKGYDSPAIAAQRPHMNGVENGFRFGRVTTRLLQPPLVLLSVENGFRFGRVTTTAFSRIPLTLSRKWLPIRKGYDP